MENVGHARRQGTKVDESLSSGKVDLRQASDDVAMDEVEMRELGDIDDLDQRRNESKTEMNSLKAQILKCVACADMKEINTFITAAKPSMEEIDAKIAAKTGRLAKIPHAIVAEQEELIQQLQTAKPTNLQRTQDIQRTGEEKDKELNQLKQEIANSDRLLSQLQRQQDNKYAAYGPGMVQDPDAWTDLLAFQLGGSTTVFAGHPGSPNHRIGTISRFCSTCTISRTIRSSSTRRIDLIFSSGDPNPDVLTILRAMEVDDEDIKRIPIIQARIESLVLFHTRREAEQISGRIGSGLAWTQDRYVFASRWVY
ncbi:hypothetical protein EV360DRAFT_81193 [Lentinula raphanica]|nr:hypothetical protein EV360DRAFT_81193 [Lentinula raphanica]